MKFNTEIFDQFDKKWALLTAGKTDNFNSMTISWGGFGTLWKPDYKSVFSESITVSKIKISGDYLIE